jgi:hypothetical protein
MTKNLTNDQLAVMAGGKTVRVWKVDREGKPVIDPTTKQRVAEDRPIAPEHIVAHRIDGDRVIIVTIDGQKLDLPLRTAARPDART